MRFIGIIGKQMLKTTDVFLSQIQRRLSVRSTPPLPLALSLQRG